MPSANPTPTGWILQTQHFPKWVITVHWGQTHSDGSTLGASFLSFCFQEGQNGARNLRLQTQNWVLANLSCLTCETCSDWMNPNPTPQEPVKPSAPWERVGEQGTFIEDMSQSWGEINPRSTGWGDPDWLPKGSKRGDFQVVDNFWGDKLYTYLLSHLLTFAPKSALPLPFLRTLKQGHAWGLPRAQGQCSALSHLSAFYLHISSGLLDTQGVWENDPL